MVLLGGEGIDVPRTWFRPGAAIIRCGPTLLTGDYIVISLILHGFLVIVEK